MFLNPRFLKSILIMLAGWILSPAMAQDAPRVAPDFTLMDLEGNQVSLSQFKGKVIYLEMWATWCGPCLEQIPHAEELHKQFKDNPEVVFINVSIDRDTVRWKKKIEDKSMTGIHLLSPGGYESDLKGKYDLTSIPRCILIDKQGIIVEYYAKRPKERGTAKSISKLLGE